MITPKRQDLEEETETQIGLSAMSGDSTDPSQAHTDGAPDQPPVESAIAASQISAIATTDSKEAIWIDNYNQQNCWERFWALPPTDRWAIVIPLFQGLYRIYGWNPTREAAMEYLNVYAIIVVLSLGILISIAGAVSFEEMNAWINDECPLWEECLADADDKWHSCDAFIHDFERVNLYGTGTMALTTQMIVFEYGMISLAKAKMRLDMFWKLLFPINCAITGLTIIGQILLWQSYSRLAILKFPMIFTAYDDGSCGRPLDDIGTIAVGILGAMISIGFFISYVGTVTGVFGNHLQIVGQRQRPPNGTPKQ